MQTFLPFPSFEASAAVLDRERLGKQRLEVKWLLEGRRNSHPAYRMWIGHRKMLARYGVAICDEWIKRGYKDNMRSFFIEKIFDSSLDNEDSLPVWYGGEIHANHRSRLLDKDFSFYSKFGWKEQPIKENYWPVPLLGKNK